MSAGVAGIDLILSRTAGPERLLGCYTDRLKRSDGKGCELRDNHIDVSKQLRCLLFPSFLVF